MDLHGHHPRRRGLVSRMRRTASSVIRFRGSSRSQDVNSRGYRYAHAGAHQHYAGALSNSSGGQVEDKGGGGSSSPELTAVPPPVMTTDIVPMAAAPATGDNPGMFGGWDVISRLIC